MNRVCTVFVGLVCVAYASGIAVGAQELSFEDVWRLIQERGSAVKAADMGVEAADARVRQAGVSPPSAISIEAENFGGSGDSRGVDRAEATVSISRQIETGGKRGLRIKVASVERDSMALEVRVQRLDAWLDAALAFTDALASRRKAALAEEDVRLSEEIRKAVEERNVAGKVSALDGIRAETGLALVRAARDRARQEALNADAALAALWGESDAKDLALRGELVVTLDGPLDARMPLAANTEVMRIEGEVELAKLQVLAERAAGKPDVEVSAGVKYAVEPGEYAFVAGLTLPLMSTGKNRDAVVAAEREFARRQQERRAVEQRVRAELLRHIGATATATAEIAALSDKVLPSAAATLVAVREGYAQGKFGYLDLLEAERSLVEIRTRLVDAQTELCRSLAETGRLVGDTGRFGLFAGSERQTGK